MENVQQSSSDRSKVKSNSWGEEEEEEKERGLAEWIAALEKLRARLISAIYRLAV